VQPPENYPTTVQEAVDYLYTNLHPDDIDALRKAKRGFLISLHHTLGRWIRNHFGLWQDNQALLDDTGTDHPDDAAMMIIERLWIRCQASKVKKP
jgi:hypothetical protein